MIGQTLSHYRITEKLGAGGMGEVYKATDTKLDREVAIKVLPEAFAENKERLARFEREARLLASLNHPNIATLFDLQEHDGTHFLVLEFVPGETLADRVKRGPIPIDELLPLFEQIAEALEAAHEKGIIHRDLKPANIKVTPEGKVKVLDFGLAKAMQPEEPVADSSQSPTLTKGTALGAIMGTAAYMSPEQARGKPVDRRSDIWAFGCCLFEGLTGKTAFLGETVSDTIAAVIGKEPDWEKLPAKTPASVRRLLLRCLNKDVNHRKQHIGDVRVEIEEALIGRFEAGPPVAVPDGGRSRKAISLAIVSALLASMLTAGSFWWFTQPTTPVQRRVTRTIIPLPEGETLPQSGQLATNSAVAISPDGRHVAYITERRDSTQLYLRALDQLAATPIGGGEDATMPFFSPDSQWLGFQRLGRLAAGELMKVSVSGGAPVAISTSGDVRGASWGPDGMIVLTPSLNAGLSRISANGGELEVLTAPNRERGEKSHRLPEVLPGARGILFTVGTKDIETFDDASIALHLSETGAYKVLLEGGTNPRYLSTGHLIYARAGSLLAVPFDIDSCEVMGAPVPVLRGVMVAGGSGPAQYGISDDGTLIYAPGDTWTAQRRLVWFSREGDMQPFIETPNQYYWPRLSPDGRLLVVTVGGANDNTWVYDLARDTMTRLASDFDSTYALWAGNSRRVVFGSTGEKQMNIFWRAVDGSDQTERLTTSEYVQRPHAWSPDGNTLLFTEHRPETGSDIWVLSLEGQRHAEPLLQTEFDEDRPSFSPDGNWIAYESNESGAFEIYIRPLSTSGGRRQVSTAGGHKPLWNANGRELFYLNGKRMMVVPLETEEDLVLGRPKLLFELPSTSFRTDYDVTPDGDRFVMVESVQAHTPPTHLILVQNWGEEVKRLVPTN